VIVTVTVLVVAGLTWSTSRGARTVEQAQAAGAAPAAVVPQGTVCAVRYQLRHDSGSDYEAQLTVATTDAVAHGRWRVQFAYPGSQHLTGQEKAVVQQGHKVIVKGRGKLRVFTLRGDYRGVNALPFSFSLDGHRCRAEVLGSATTSGSADNQDGVSEAAGPEKHDSTRAPTGNAPTGNAPTGNAPTGNAPTGGTTPTGSGTSGQRGKPHNAGSAPESTPSALPATPPSATARKAGGLSLAL
jgi:serine/threonine-protein kinase